MTELHEQLITYADINGFPEDERVYPVKLILDMLNGMNELLWMLAAEDVNIIDYFKNDENV